MKTQFVSHIKALHENLVRFEERNFLFWHMDNLAEAVRIYRRMNNKKSLLENVFLAS